jgi:hypothetical protein
VGLAHFLFFHQLQIQSGILILFSYLPLPRLTFLL